MAAKNGAGGRMTGVLERPPLNSPQSDEPEALEQSVPPADEPDATRGRGQTARKARKPRARTIYLPDDLFERIIVQAHRRDRTISEYVTAVLERQVPDHRTVRVESTSPESNPA
jgi:hypothetical protein